MGITIINHQFWMAYTTHLWWLGDGLLLLYQHYPLFPTIKKHGFPLTSKPSHAIEAIEAIEPRWTPEAAARPPWPRPRPGAAAGCGGPAPGHGEREREREEGILYMYIYIYIQWYTSILVLGFMINMINWQIVKSNPRTSNSKLCQSQIIWDNLR